jgi:hypothetical protein
MIACGSNFMLTAVGSGANVCLDLSEQEDEQGLRAATCYERSFHLRSYGSSDGKALSPCSIVFGQSLRVFR